MNIIITCYYQRLHGHTYNNIYINTDLKQTKPVSAGGAVHTKLTVLLLFLAV